MGFFQRNRDDLAARGYSPERLPPGQYFTERFPVLHVGDVPVIERSDWTLTIFGLVAEPRELTFADLVALPTVEVVTDIHCVTKWSKFDTVWRGVRFRDVLELVEVSPRAAHVIEHAEYGYTTNVPLADCLGDDVLIAWEYSEPGGTPVALTAEHGGPVRFVLPKLYFWKSAKWLRGIELSDVDKPGFWERNGYHNYGDPFREQRYTHD
jgi:DMSO/TMAO reductase YedYZ molybdopterin-dependent catalytic subunit